VAFTRRKILCVDDDADDLSFLTEAIRDIDPHSEIVEKKNGVEAIRFLTEAIVNDELPCLVLLDVNMPFLDGKQTLGKIRKELSLQDLPVVILTSSQNPNDRSFFKTMGANMYTKPIHLAELNKMVKSFLSHCD